MTMKLIVHKSPSELHALATMMERNPALTELAEVEIVPSKNFHNGKPAPHDPATAGPDDKDIPPIHWKRTRKGRDRWFTAKLGSLDLRVERVKTAGGVVFDAAIDGDKVLRSKSVVRARERVKSEAIKKLQAA